MFGWFGLKPQCPLDPITRQWFDQRWAWLESQFGRERLCKGRVILPDVEFFPDAYHGSVEDAQQIFERVCVYMDIDPSTVQMNLYESESPSYDGEFRSGTAGLYTQEGDQFRIWVEITNLVDPLGMVATMAHELGHVHLLGHGRISSDEEDHEPLTDLLTVYFGMGIFSANSVIQENNFRIGNQFAWSVKRQGYLGMELYGYAIARFAMERGEHHPKWARSLRLDVRTAFKKSMRFLLAEAKSRRA